MEKQLFGCEISEYSIECAHSESFAEENAAKAFLLRSAVFFNAEPCEEKKDKKIIFSENPLDIKRGDARFYTEGADLVFEGFGYDSMKIAVMLFFDIYGKEGKCPEPFCVDEYCEKNGIDKFEYVSGKPLVFTDAHLSRVERPSDGVALVYWHNHTSLPDETVSMLGTNFENGIEILISRIADEIDGADERAIEPLMVSDNSVMFTIPADMKMGIFSVRIKNSHGVSDEILVNAPDAWWFIADDGEEITENGYVQIMGNALSFDGRATVKLVSHADGKEHFADVFFADEYCVKASVKGLPLGKYDIYVNNGYGDDRGWVRHDWIECVKAYERRDEKIVLSPEEGDMFQKISSALAELEKNGGGTLVLTQGEYTVDGPIRLGKGVAIVGEGDVRVNMYAAVNYFARSMSDNIYFNFIDTPAEELVYVLGDGVRINRTTFIKSEEYNRDKGMLWKAFVAERIKNLQVYKSELYADYFGFDLNRSSYATIRSCRIKAGAGGIYFRACNRVTAEDNLMTTVGLVAGSTIWINNSSISNSLNYVARNRMYHSTWGYREGVSYDNHGTFYFGRATAKGCDIFTEYAPQMFFYVLPSIPSQRSAYRRNDFYTALATHKRDDREWHGLTALIVAGKGMGQYRNVEMIEDQLVVIDREWDVMPDETSLFSIGVFNGRHIIDKNYIETASCLQTYPPNFESIVSNNVLYRGGTVGTNSSSCTIDEKPYGELCGGGWRKGAPMYQMEPNVLTTVVGNRGITGNHGIGYEGRSLMGPMGNSKIEEYEVRPTLGITVKRNDLGAFYILSNKGATDSCVLEKNKIHDNFSGMRIDCDSSSVRGPVRFIVRENRQMNTRVKLWTKSPIADKEGAQDYEA